LEWLRQAYPLDEQGAAARWAESEALRLEKELRMDLEKKGERLGLFKRDGEVVDNEGLEKKRDVDAGSVLMQRQKQIKEERKLKEEQEKEGRLEAEDGVEMNKKRRSRELSPWAAAKVAEYGVFPNFTQLRFPRLIFLFLV
jgi:rhomboid-like protein